MPDDHRHLGYEAALAQLAGNIDELTDDIDKLVTAFGEMLRDEREARAEYRADINRLYEFMSEHLREGHGS